MKLLITLLFAATLAAQTVPSGSVTSSLPSYLVGSGLEWNRYASYPFGNVTSLGVRIGNSNIYSYSSIDSPIARSTPPPTSAIRTGAAYVAAQSSNATVFLVFIGEAGMAVTANTTSASFSGGLGVAIRVKKTNWYVMPLFRATGTSATSTQPVPEVMLWYSFGGN